MNILPDWNDNASICDCGIGTAAFSLALAQMMNPTIQITGIEWHWGNRCFSPIGLSALMQEAGLIKLRCVAFPIGLARLTSMAYVGFRKDEVTEKANGF